MVEPDFLVYTNIEKWSKIDYLTIQQKEGYIQQNVNICLPCFIFVVKKRGCQNGCFWSVPVPQRNVFSILVRCGRDEAPLTSDSRQTALIRLGEFFSTRLANSIKSTRPKNELRTCMIFATNKVSYHIFDYLNQIYNLLWLLYTDKSKCYHGSFISGTLLCDIWGTCKPSCNMSGAGCHALLIGQIRHGFPRDLINRWRMPHRPAPTV